MLLWHSGGSSIAKKKKKGKEGTGLSCGILRAAEGR